MIITQNRFKWTEKSTLSQWHIDGESTFYSTKHDKMLPIFALEDKDRDLYLYMSEDEIKSVKVPKETAIPYGMYKVILSFSNRFQKIMPEVIGVRGFAGIRIHNGSFVKDTEGCPLIGYKWSNLVNENAYMVSWSRDCFNEFLPTLKRKLETEEVYLEIVK